MYQYIRMVFEDIAALFEVQGRMFATFEPNFAYLCKLMREDRCIKNWEDWLLLQLSSEAENPIYMSFQIFLLHSIQLQR